MSARSLLILGGTGEAAALAGAALARFGNELDVTTSLAGRTRRPGALAGRVRSGGFGGPAGLAGYLGAHRVDRLIDATHPFAARISRAARLACDAAGVPRLMLLRPPWRRNGADRWIEVDDIATAAALVGRIGRRAWLTVGSTDVAAFAAATSVQFVVRVAEPPPQILPLRGCAVIVGRGPFTLAEERRHLERHAVDVLVCKASGGAATEAKLVAARELGIPVLMIRRPPREPGRAVDSIVAALDWLGAPPS